MIVSTDQDKDVVDILAAIVRDAHSQAEMVRAFLEANGFLPPKNQHGEKSWSLPPSLLLKLGALTKLYLLDKADLKSRLPAELPSWQDVYADVVAEAKGKDTRFSAEQLSTELLKILIQQLCWTPLENSFAAVAISQTLDPDTFLDQLAQVLWESRHLGHDMEGDNDEPESQE